MPESLASTANSPGQNAEASFEGIVQFLLDPATYPENTGPVTLCETHISCVFLTSRYAYKLKKPVQFQFVDFRDHEARHRACEDEVRLNRRLAGDVYLGVVPILRDADGKLRLGASGAARPSPQPSPPRGEGALKRQVVDWLVQMRRLPQDRMLDTLIENRRVRPADVERFSGVLVSFYRQARPLEMEPAKYRAEIERHVRANRAELLDLRHHLPAPTVRRVHTAQLLLLTALPEVLENRASEGRVIEGHGDLRPEHICLEEEPVVFDCLEFSAELRRLDVVDELGFLAMECDYLGGGFVGRAVLEAYQQASGDRPQERLLCFYQSYRACVRAKVAALRAEQLAGAAADTARDTAWQYLQLADGYARRLAAPFVLVTRGLSGSGKTTVARRLAEMLGAMRLGTDDVRREMPEQGSDSPPPFGQRPGEGSLTADRPSPQPSPRRGEGELGASAATATYAEGRYSPAARAAVYEELCRRASELLEHRESVILDGTFLSAQWLERAGAMAKGQGAHCLVIDCHCPDEVAKQRMAARAADDKNLSEALPEHRRRQAEELEAIPEGLVAVDLDTSGDVPDHQLAPLLRQLVE